MKLNPSDIKLSLPIDEDGCPYFDGIRVTDQDVGRELLNNIHRVEGHGALISFLHDDYCIVEAFDEPYVAENVSPGHGVEHWILHLPYGLEKPFSLNLLTLDPWDRFHGVTESGVPFVFSRKAQAEFFNQMDEFSDDSITFKGKTILIGEWLGESKDPLNQEFWSNLYHTKETPWDLNQHNPILESIIPQLKLTKSRVLVLGCGAGHDAAYFANAGHMVTSVDYSDNALQKAVEIYGQTKNLDFKKFDALNLPKEYIESFDLVFDHTFFCAIPPDKRDLLVDRWTKYLAPQGHLLSIFFVFDKFGGPPFGASEWELQRRLEKKFQFLYWTRWKHSIARRHGQELVVYAKKKDF